MVVGQQKGADTEENVRRNFGMPHPEGYRKAMRIMELAERCGLPVVTFVDVPGAHPGPESEERGIAEAIARSVGLMTRLRTPIVTVITGEGGSGGALAIAVGDVVLALENAVYSVISPEGCASILWRTTRRGADGGAGDADERDRPAAPGRRSTRSIPEPADGAQADPAETGAAAEVGDRRASWTGWRPSRSTRWSNSAIAGTVRSARSPSSRARRRRRPSRRVPAWPNACASLLEAGQRAIPAPLPVGRRDEPPAREDV